MWLLCLLTAYLTSENKKVHVEVGKHCALCYLCTTIIDNLYYQMIRQTKSHHTHTFMMLWQVDSGSPTRLVPLIDMIWSPMFSLPDLSAGPACIMLAMITVGRMEPQPLSTMTTPRISPLPFSMNTWAQGKEKQNHFKVREKSNLTVTLSWMVTGYLC